MDAYRCTNCHRPYPDDAFPHRCLHCGGIFSVAEAITYVEPDESASGIWRYAASFGLDLEALPVTLGEGATPLVKARAFDKDVYFKLEFLNPSGSFKDRATAPLITEIKSRGIERAVEDSSGNAGASFAAYAARASMEAKVFVPESASGPKLEQIRAYGAHLEAVPGPRSAAAEAVLQATENGTAYASHAYLPFGLPGLATIAYEIYVELGEAPSTLLSPTGHGSLLLGAAMGFEALRAAGKIEKLPYLVAAQAAACAPLWVMANLGPSGLGAVQEGETLAEGVGVRNPLRGDELLARLQPGAGQIRIVEEDRILLARNALAALGFYVETTSAIVWDALQQVVGEIPEPIVVILTGSGLKNSSAINSNHQDGELDA